MTATLTLATDPLLPLKATLATMAGRPGPSLNGLATGLTVVDPTGWTPATALTSGEALPDLLEAARLRWDAAPHAAAALAWKCYSFWVALPAVLGYAGGRRVPLVRPEAVLARWSDHQPFVKIGLASVEVAVLPSDPLALPSRSARRAAGIRVVPDEDALLTALREALMDDHLAPIIENIRSSLHLGRRTLWGSLASGVAHGLSRAVDVVPGPILGTASRVLDALGLADLVDLSPNANGRGGLSVQRRTCCLAFTLPQPTVCTGCCIR